ncbi:MAG: hypothetical protein AAF908_02490, partial [Pseudomonadota bacterium]
MDHDFWTQHFHQNARGRPEPDWQAPITLTERQIKALRPSLAQFQLGDGGGPATLIAWNRARFLTRPGIRPLVDAWFAEEREHSRLLGAALARFGGVPITGHWSFSVFLVLRRWGGIEAELMI